MTKPVPLAHPWFDAVRVYELTGAAMNWSWVAEPDVERVIGKLEQDFTLKFRVRTGIVHLQFLDSTGLPVVM